MKVFYPCNTLLIHGSQPFSFFLLPFDTTLSLLLLSLLYFLSLLLYHHHQHHYFFFNSPSNGVAIHVNQWTLLQPITKICEIASAVSISLRNASRLHSQTTPHSGPCFGSSTHSLRWIKEVTWIDSLALIRTHQRPYPPWLDQRGKEKNRGVNDVWVTTLIYLATVMVILNKLHSDKICYPLCKTKVFL